MEEQNRIPKLLELLFGEAAGAARQGASERLLRWCQVFDAWLGEMQAHYKPSTTKQAVQTWRRLLQHSRKMPWELSQADFEAHAAWLQAEGIAASTICTRLSYLADFYRWCGAQHIDLHCGAGFNPVAGVPRPRVQRYAHARLLSRGEVAALLGILQRDTSPLGRREYAFFLARLRLGVPLQALRTLRWGQIEVANGEAWVQWRPEAARSARSRLPGEVWQALQAWLRASGRLAGMRRESYVFTPQRFPGKFEEQAQAQAWVEQRPLSRGKLLAYLKLYGRAAGIAEQKLTLKALRFTATRMQVEAGEDGQAAGLARMQAFLEGREDRRKMKYRLGKLPPLPPDEQRRGLEAEKEPELPDRKAKRFIPGEGTKHGIYARSQPEQAVLAVVQENIQGIDEQVYGLRTLGRLLLERQGRATSSKELARLGEAYSILAVRVSEVIKAEQQMAAGGKKSQWVDEFLLRLDAMQQEKGEPPLSEQVRKEAMGYEAALGNEPLLEAAARRLVEEIAALRYVLRNTYRLALDAHQTDELVRLVDLYGVGCIRLVRMLKVEKSDDGRLERYVRGELDKALEEVREELGLR